MRTAVEMEAEVWRLMRANKLHDAAMACDQLNQQYPDFVQGWSVAASLAPVAALACATMKQSRDSG